MSYRKTRMLGGLWTAVLACSAAIGAEPGAVAPDAGLDEVEIVATGLFPGIGVKASLVPSHVQHIDAAAISRQHEHDMGEVLNSGATSVNVNDTQGNPFQRDVTFRGFTGSPVLGTPQGISVFIDGVRVNEAFGDTLSWDLISPQMISQIDIVPGSNPVYGLNTLAGAIAIQTKRGNTSPGTVTECSGGSFGRIACGLETGGTRGAIDYFAAADTYRDHGWGQENPSTLQHYFGRVGLLTGATDVSLSATVANDELHGNQTIPLAFLSDPTQAYTYPDLNTNRLVFLNLTGLVEASDEWVVAGSVHYRRLLSHVANSNVNGNFNATIGLAPGNAPTSNAINDIAQYRPGASAQATTTQSLLGHQNSLTIGAEWERGSTDFVQFNQDAGYSRNTSSSAPALLQTSLHALNELAGAYLNETWRASDRLALTLAMRYSRAHTRLSDNLGTANNGDEVFSKLLPAGGLALQLSPTTRAFVNFGEGMRVPSPVELTCANPSAPCQLPNAFSSDPPLRPVIAQTYEVGLDGRLGGAWNWNFDLFRTTLLDDIQFIGAGVGSLNSGYFQNVGSTRRQGLEAGLTGQAGRARIDLHYSYTDATFRSPLALFSPDNTSASGPSCASSGNCTSIAVAPGDRLPGVPRHNGHVRIEYAVTPRASLAIEGVAQSAQYARGDENNQDARGPIPGFAVLNLDAHFAASERLSVFVRVANLLNRQYSTFGALGTNYFTGPLESYVYPTAPVPGVTVGSPNATSGGGATSSAQVTQFRSVGPPRGAWLGVTYAFGGAASGVR